MQFSKVRSITLTITVLLLLTLTSHAQSIENLVRENVNRLKDVHTWSDTTQTIVADDYIKRHGREAYEELIFNSSKVCPICRRGKGEK